MSSIKVENTLNEIAYAGGINTAKPISATSNVDFQGTNTRYTASNFISTSAGVQNALTANLVDANGTAVPLAAGLEIIIKTGRLLQKDTAITLALNGGAAKAIKSQSSGGLNNVHTNLLTGALLGLIYDGTQFQVAGF